MVRDFRHPITTLKMPGTHLTCILEEFQSMCCGCPQQQRRSHQSKDHLRDAVHQQQVVCRRLETRATVTCGRARLAPFVFLAELPSEGYLKVNVTSGIFIFKWSVGVECRITTDLQAVITTCKTQPHSAETTNYLASVMISRKYDSGERSVALRRSFEIWRFLLPTTAEIVRHLTTGTAW